MKNIHVIKQGDEWVGKQAGQAVSHGETKEAAVKNTAAVAKADPEKVSVKIHKVDGTIQEERTYPRSADPKRSPG